MDAATIWFGILQIATLLLILGLLYRPLGDAIAHIYTSAKDWRVERGVYRLIGLDSRSEQTWQAYLRGVLMFSVMGVLFVYLLQRGQQWLPFSLGLPAGARIAVQVEKSVEALMLYLATLRAGLCQRRRVGRPDAQELLDLGHCDDRQRQDQADDPLLRGEVHRVEDAVEEPELRGRNGGDDRQGAGLEQGRVGQGLGAHDGLLFVGRLEREPDVGQ